MVGRDVAVGPLRFAVVSAAVARVAAPLALIAIALFGFHVLKHSYGLMSVASPANVNIVLGLCLLGTPSAARDLPASFRILLYYVNAATLFYLLASYRTDDLTLGHLAADSLALPVVFGIAAFWRPSLGLLPIMVVQWNKLLVERDLGFPITPTDYTVVIELGLLLSLMVVLWALLRIAALVAERSKLATPFDWRSLGRNFLLYGLTIAAAIHFSNYFYSGFQKVILDGAGPFDWVWRNPTYLLTVSSSYMGYLTLYDVPGLPTSINTVLAFVTVPLNATVLVFQLGAVFAIMSRRATIGFTIFYDLMHAAIFVLTAIFFWKWILLNLGIVHAMILQRRDLPRLPIVVGLAASLLVLLAPYTFFVATLGWFDTGAINYAHFQATTADGRRIEVPSNFFLDKSVTFAQQRVGWPYTGHLPTSTWGTTQSFSTMVRMNEHCGAGEPLHSALDPGALARVGTMLARHHKRMVEMSGNAGHFNYDLYPHHIWSSPFRYPEFRVLDLRTVRSYILVVESICLSLGPDGRPAEKVLVKGEYAFPVTAD